MTNEASSTRELGDELFEIQQEMLELLERARRILHNAPILTRQRAEAYWLPHVTTALTSDHSYLGGSMVTMENTITELFEATEEDEVA